MPVHFKTVRWKNFLSTGNAFTEISLDANKTCLIFGKNGSGKSTLLDAITFGLFGKAFRNVNKPALVNTVNDKNCIVEIEFSVDTKAYKVIRGLKPSVFEIYCDGVLLNQDAASRDYQKVLEQQILKFSYKTFTQVVILGSAQYVPFMQLPLSGRREVIEDLLDIRIFSVMNSLLKEKSTKTRDDISHIDSAVQLAVERVNAQKKLIKVLEESSAERKRDITLEIERLEEELITIDEKIENGESEISSKYDDVVSKISYYNDQLDTMRGAVAAHKKSIQDGNKQIKFFEDNDHCSICKQGISTEHKHQIVGDIERKNGELLDNAESIKEKMAPLENDLDYNRGVLDSINLTKNAIKVYKTERGKIKSRIQELNTKLSEGSDDKIVEEKAKLKDIASKALESTKKKEILTKLKHIQELSSLLLKDGGIKTAIIKEYLPIFNKLINRYLAIMDLYVDFHLDETFNESMKSRFRDTFSYASFSEGEKQRIDLALLFAFREVAKLKNSLSTNLIILDEVFDSSLDTNGVDFVMQLLAELKDANVFIVSHNTNLISGEIFDDTIQFEKRGDFSVMCKDKGRFAQ